MDLLGKQQEDGGHHHDGDDRRHHRREQAEIALGVGREHDRARHGAGAGEQRRGERKDGDLGMALRFGLGILALFDGQRRGGAGTPAQRHLERDGEQDDAARGL